MIPNTKLMIPKLPTKFKNCNVIPLTNALTNQVYKLEIQGGNGKEYYLLRVFGSLLSRKYENRLLKYISQNGHPVDIVYSEKTYRIESWINHKEVFPYEIPILSTQIASKLGWYHSLCPPIEKTNVILDGLYEMANEINYKLPFSYLNSIKNHELVLGHNDLQYGNILKTDNGIVFIDFEYSGYVPRYYDIANHFCEFMADYASDSPELLKYSKFPSLQLRESFYSSYLSSLSSYSADSDSANEESSSLLEFDQQVGFYSLLSHLYWGVWGLYKSKSMDEKRSFDYNLYGSKRLERFHELLALEKGEGNISI